MLDGPRPWPGKENREFWKIHGREFWREFWCEFSPVNFFFTYSLHFWKIHGIMLPSKKPSPKAKFTEAPGSKIHKGQGPPNSQRPPKLSPKAIPMRDLSREAHGKTPSAHLETRGSFCCSWQLPIVSTTHMCIHFRHWESRSIRQCMLNLKHESVQCNLACSHAVQWFRKPKKRFVRTKHTHDFLAEAERPKI